MIERILEIECINITQRVEVVFRAKFESNVIAHTSYRV